MSRGVSTASRWLIGLARKSTTYGLGLGEFCIPAREGKQDRSYGRTDGWTDGWLFREDRSVIAKGGISDLPPGTGDRGLPIITYDPLLAAGAISPAATYHYEEEEERNRRSRRRSQRRTRRVEPAGSRGLVRSVARSQILLLLLVSLSLSFSLGFLFFSFHLFFSSSLLRRSLHLSFAVSLSFLYRTVSQESRGCEVETSSRGLHDF